MNAADRAPRRTIYWLITVSILCYATADSSWWLAGVSLPVLWLGWLLTERRHDWHLPQAVITAAVLLALAHRIFEAYVSGRVQVSDFSELVIAVLVVKSFERKRSRDWAQLITLSVFLVLGAIMTSARLLVGVWLLVLLPMTLSAAMAFQSIAARARVDYRTRWSPPHPAPPSVRVAGELRRIAAMSVPIALAIAAAVFILLPRRVGQDAFGDWGQANLSRLTRFAESIDLSMPGSVSESHDAVLLLRVRDREGRSLGGPVRYLRGVTLDEYDGKGGWKPRNAGEPLDWHDAGPTTNLDLRSTQRDVNEYHEVTLLFVERSVPTVLFAQDAASRVRVLDRSGRVAHEYADLRGDDRRMNAIKFRGGGGSLRYEVSVAPPARARPGNRKAPQAAKTTHAAAHGLAVQILTEAGIPLDHRERTLQQDHRVAELIEHHLRTNFTYSLNNEPSGYADDPVTNFLTKARAGHCEYFASSMALMCRTVGLPARVVTGLVAADYNDLAGQYIVRASNAHAWVEVQTADNVWELFDPTAPSTLNQIHRPAPSAANSVRRWWDAIELAWVRGVVGFDARTRQDLLGYDETTTDRIAESVRQRQLRIQAGGRGLWVRALINGGMVFVGVFALMRLLILVIALVSSRNGKRRPRGGDTDRLWTRAHDRLCRHLRKAGLPRGASVPVAQAAGPVLEAGGDVGAELASFIEAYRVARFGGRITQHPDDPLRWADRLGRLIRRERASSGR